MTTKYKSKYEAKIAGLLPCITKKKAIYEVTALPYVIQSNYRPDFKINDKLYVETKGKFDCSDRRKMKLIKEAYPDITIIMCFMNPNVKITKKSKTTYADWCDKNGIPWCVEGNLIATLKTYLN